MNKPELNVVRLNCADVIATSGLYLLTGADDTVAGNLQFKTPSGSVLNATQFNAQYGSAEFYNSTNIPTISRDGVDLFGFDTYGTKASADGPMDGYWSWSDDDGFFTWRSGPDT